MPEHWQQQFLYLQWHFIHVLQYQCPTIDLGHHPLFIRDGTAEGSLYMSEKQFLSIRNRIKCTTGYELLGLLTHARQTDDVLGNMSPAGPALALYDDVNVHRCNTLDVVLNIKKRLAATLWCYLVVALLPQFLLLYDVLDVRKELATHVLLLDIVDGSHSHRLNGIIHRAIASHQVERLEVAHFSHPSQNIRAVLSALAIQHKVNEQYIGAPGPFNEPLGLLHSLTADGTDAHGLQFVADRVAVRLDIINYDYLAHPLSALSVPPSWL